MARNVNGKSGPQVLEKPADHAEGANGASEVQVRPQAETAAKDTPTTEKSKKKMVDIEIEPALVSTLGMVSAEVVTMTPALAAEWLNAFKYEKQRDLNRLQVEFLTQQMLSRRFKPSAIEIYEWLHGPPGRNRFLTDGQHRLTAVVHWGQRIPKEWKGDYGFGMPVITVRVETMDEVDQAYYRTDRGKGRSPSEMIDAADLVAATNIPRLALNRALGAIKALVGGFTKATDDGNFMQAKDLDFQREVVLRWRAQIRGYLDETAKPDAEIKTALLTAVPLALGMVTLKSEPERAARFWRTIAQNDGLKAGSPEQMAYKLLRGQKYDKQKENVYARLLAQCWNAAYHERERVTLKPIKNPKEPLFLEGTPFDGMRLAKMGPNCDIV